MFKFQEVLSLNSFKIIGKNILLIYSEKGNDVCHISKNYILFKNIFHLNFIIQN